MILECPHCHATVLARAGECPSCRKRVDDLSGTDPTRTALRIREGAPLPAHCALCDAPSTRLATVRRVARSGMPVEARVFLGAVGLIFGVVPVAILIATGRLQGLIPVLALPFYLLLVFIFFGIMTGFLWPFVIALLAAGFAASSSRPRGAPAFVRNRRPVRVHVPLCDRCRGRALEPISVDTEALAMTFLVDRSFAERAARAT